MEDLVGAVPVVNVPAGHPISVASVPTATLDGHIPVGTTLPQRSLLTEKIRAYDVLSDVPELSTFKALVDAVPEYQAFLQGTQPVLIYAPSNDALANLSAEELRTLLSRHIYPQASFVELTYDGPVERFYPLGGGGVVLVGETMLHEE